MPPTTSREVLLATAARLIHTRGYHAVSVDEICRAAALHKGSFYHHFPSKQALALATLAWQWALAREHLLDPAFAPDIPPLARIERFFLTAYVKNRDANLRDGCFLGCPFGNAVAELGATDPAMRQLVRTIFAGWADYFARALTEAAAAGAVPHHDVPAAAKALVAHFQGAMLLAMAEDDVSALDPRSLPAPWAIAAAFVRAPADAPALAPRVGRKNRGWVGGS